MSSERFFKSRNRIFMEVKPVDSLLHSHLIKSVLERGDKFVVDMNTGALTISSSKGGLKELGTNETVNMPSGCFKFSISFPDNFEKETIVSNQVEHHLFWLEESRRRGVRNMIVKIALAEAPHQGAFRMWVYASDSLTTAINRISECMQTLGRL